MIHDGYNYAQTYTGANGTPLTILYRPMVWWQRLAVLDFMNHHSTDSGAVYLTESIQDQIIAIDGLANDKHMHLLGIVQDSCEGKNTIIKDVIGFGGDKQEADDEVQLAKSAEVYWQFPHFNKFTCDTCKQFICDPLTGEITKFSRGPEDVLLCRTQAGCPKISPEDEWIPNWRHWQALTHHKMCQHYGYWPDDPIVQKNKTIIEKVYNEVMLNHGNA